MNNFYLILTTVFLAYIIAQFFKLFTHKKLTFKHFLLGTGGLPSAHSSAITSLSAIIYLTQGLTSLLAVSLILTILVIRDAVGVRYAVGVNAEILKKKFPKEKVLISKGHTLQDVFFGVVIGIIVATAVFLIW